MAFDISQKYSRTTIGLRVKDGIVLAVEKLVHSKLLVPGTSNRRIQTIDKHIGLVRGFSSRWVLIAEGPAVPRLLPVISLTADTSPIEQDRKPLTSVNSTTLLHKSR